MRNAQYSRQAGSVTVGDTLLIENSDAAPCYFRFSPLRNEHWQKEIALRSDTLWPKGRGRDKIVPGDNEFGNIMLAPATFVKT